MSLFYTSEVTCEPFVSLLLLTSLSVRGCFDSSLCVYLDDWYLWIKPQCLLQIIAVITAATRSVNLALQSTKTQVWKGSCQDPIPPEFQDKVTLTLSCLGGHLQIHGDTEPSPVVLGEQATMVKTIQTFFRKLPPHLQTLTLRDSMCRP